tara:strand:- start:620 stop:820 length:201 start_codon:yes stop_codon:yes gene_type:complete
MQLETYIENVLTEALDVMEYDLADFKKAMIAFIEEEERDNAETDADSSLSGNPFLSPTADLTNTEY